MYDFLTSKRIDTLGVQTLPGWEGKYASCKHSLSLLKFTTTTCCYSCSKTFTESMSSMSYQIWNQQCRNISATGI